jgi:hypothetical protein
MNDNKKNDPIKESPPEEQYTKSPIWIVLGFVGAILIVFLMAFFSKK